MGYNEYNSLEKQPVFVANRVAEILELTTTDEWNYVQSSDNSADAGTRDLSGSALQESSWLKGPEFLKPPQWPFDPSEDFRWKLKKPKIPVRHQEQNRQIRWCPQLSLQLHKLSSGRSVVHTRNSCAL